VKPPAFLLCHPVQGASERSARWVAMVKLYWINVVWSSIVHPIVGILVMDTLLLSDIDVDIPWHPTIYGSFRREIMVFAHLCWFTCGHYNPYESFGDDHLPLVKCGQVTQFLTMAHGNAHMMFSDVQWNNWDASIVDGNIQGSEDGSKVFKSTVWPIFMLTRWKYLAGLFFPIGQSKVEI
jgi:hypothetical protein